MPAIMSANEREAEEAKRMRNMFEKIWEAHEVSEGLIYIDLHLVHEVTSPQAFDGLRMAGRPCAGPTGPSPPPTTTRRPTARWRRA